MNRSRILIVEDEAVVSLEISRRLQDLGYEPAGRAMTGEQALALVEERQPDLVLMDIRLMEATDGITAAKEIRYRFNTPVIFLTAYWEDDTMERVKSAEPYGYILKPFDDREIKSAIEIALYKHHAEVEIRRLNRLYDVLSQVSRMIVRTESREELFPAVCRLMVERGEVDLAWIGRIDPESSRIDIITQFGERRELLEDVFCSGKQYMEWDGMERAIREGRPFVCNDCGNGRCMYPMEKGPGKPGFMSRGSFPLSFQGNIWGTVNICVSKPDFFQDREITLLKKVAMDISFALDKIQGDERRKAAELLVRRENTVLSGINRVFREALSSHSEEDLGRICLSVAEEVTGSRLGFLGRIGARGEFKDTALSDSAREACGVAGHTGHFKQSSGADFAGIHGTVLRDGKGFFTNDPASRPDSMGLPPGHSRVDAFLGIPLVHNAKSVGMIGLGNREGGYGPEELEAMEALAPAVAEAFSRKRSEKALARSRAEFQAIFNSISDAIVLTSTKREILMVNPGFTALFGYEAEEIHGRSTEILYPSRREYDERGRNYYHPGEGVDKSRFETMYRRKDGSLFPAESLGIQVKDAEGRMVGLLGVHRDITERKRAEELLRNSEEHFRNTFEQAAVGMSIVSPSGVWLRINQRLCRILGYSHDELIKLNYRSITHPEDLDEDAARIQQMLAGTRNADSWETRYIRIDGQVIWARITTSLARSEDGTPQYFVTVTEDITEQVRQREQITLLNRLYNVLSQVSQAVVRVKSSQVFLEEACRIITEEGGFLLTWIGYVEEETNRVVPTAIYGRAEDYARRIAVYADDRPEGRGPTGRCIRKRRSFVYNDFLGSELAKPWRERAAGFGIRSVAAFPVVSEGSVLGALTVYADKVDAFGESVTRLLEKVTEEIGFALDNMERARQHEQAVEALRESEDLYHSLVENMAQGAFYQHFDGSLFDVNPAALRILGLSRGEFLGRTSFDRAWDIIHEDGSPFPGEEHPSIVALKTGMPVKDVVAGIFNPRTKERVWAVINATPQFRQGEARPYRVFVTLHDITSLKNAEKEQEATVEFLRLLNTCKTKEEMVRGATEFFQRQSGCEAVGIRLREGDDYPYFETRGFPREFVSAENYLCARDRDGKVMRDGAGNPVLACMCGNVISGRFDPSEPFFTPNGSFWTNCTTELLASTTEADRQARTRNRCNGEGYESVALVALRSGDEPFGLLQLNDSRKGCFTIETIARWERLAGYLAVALSKFKAEEATEALRGQKELILSSAGEGILGLDTDGRHVFANPSAASMLGYEAHELIGKTGHDLYHHTKDGGLPYPEEECPICQTYRKGIYCRLTEELFWRKDGTSFPVRYSSAPIMDGDRIQGAVITFRDITQHRLMEEERAGLEARLAQAQKMEALGTLAGGIAHDFNNILGVILGYVEMAKYDAPEGTTLGSDLQQVLKATYRARDLVSHILTFSRQGQTQELRPISLGPIVKETLKLLRASLPSTIEIRRDISDKAGAVLGDPTQLHQILMNLCTNAAHAMRPKGGVLEIRLTSAELHAETAKNYEDLEEGKYVKLTVADTGHGMGQATLKRIFDPYFTTKEVGEGTGLGLAVVHGIVKRHRGAVKVFSDPGKGTTFEILFPKIDTPLEETTRVRREVPTGTERILFVDDEQSLTELGLKMLSRLGYQVTTKTNSLEALELFRSQSDAFDLVITDQTMPRMTGFDLTAKLQQIRRDIPIILCTGYSDTIDEKKANEMGIRAFIMKPIDRLKIAEAIRRALGEK
jgi:PAS domain S-box-containing protein